MNRKIKCPICRKEFGLKEIDDHKCIWDKEISYPIIKGYILTMKYKKN